MFKLQASPTFEAPVRIASPAGEQVLTLVFRHKTRAEFKAYFERVAASEGDTPEAKVVCEIVEGWKDVDTPFSEAAVAELLQNYFGAVTAIFDAYFAALTQAKRGNSNGSPAISTT